MSLSDTLDAFRSDHECGDFLFLAGEQLRDVVRREKVPQKFGVYLVYAARGRKRELVYIGKAGTLRQNGDIGAQTIAGRLTNRQDGMPRTQYFAEKMAEEQIDRLCFEWFVTYWEASACVPPFVVEAQLLGAYFAERGCLPRWNKSA